MAALGCIDCAAVVGLRIGAGLAQFLFAPSGTALPGKAPDRRSVSDLWIHTRSAVFAGRQACSGLVIQSAVVHGTRFVLCRRGRSDYLGPPSLHQPDEHRTQSRLGCGGHAVYCKLGVCHFLCGVRLACFFIAEHTYIC